MENPTSIEKIHSEKIRFNYLFGVFSPPSYGINLSDFFLVEINIPKKIDRVLYSGSYFARNTSCQPCRLPAKYGVETAKQTQNKFACKHAIYETFAWAQHNASKEHTHGEHRAVCCGTHACTHISAAPPRQKHNHNAAGPGSVWRSLVIQSNLQQRGAVPDPYQTRKRPGLAQPDPARLGPACLDSVQSDPSRLGPSWSGPARRDLVRSGPSRFGPDHPGVWSNLRPRGGSASYVFSFCFARHPIVVVPRPRPPPLGLPQLWGRQRQGRGGRLS